MSASKIDSILLFPKLFYKNGKLISEGDTFLNPDFADFLDWRGAKGCESDKSIQELSDESLVAKIGVDFL